MEVIRRAAEIHLPRCSPRSRQWRLLLFAAVCVMWMGLLLVRLWDFQIRRGEEFSGRAAEQQVEEITIRAERGAIYDRRGVELALSPFVDSIGIFPHKVNDKALTAKALTQALGISPSKALELVNAKGFRYVKRFAEPAEADRLAQLEKELKLTGLQFEKEGKRYYPKGSVASHVLGWVNIDGDGLGGLEHRYDSSLKGQPGVRRVHFDALGRQYESSVVRPPVAGSSLILTIDESIQTIAESNLAAAIEKTRSRAGTIVMMDPVKGDVLAMANWPPFDPSSSPRNESEVAERRSYAISHLYEPGSTFKMVTVAAALEEGLTKPTEMIDCQNGAIYIGRRRIRDHKPYGMLSVSEIIANSSNVGAIKLGMRLGAERFHDYVRRFGFGNRTGIELPGEIDGLVRPAKAWRDGSVASISMGHEIGVTPLQMAQAFSVAANGGYLVRPRIVEAIRKPDGTIEQPERPAPVRIISADTAAKLRAMMEQTVVKGTARAAYTPGYRVAGKTGTAQMIDPATRTYSTQHHIASFAAIAPLNDPSITTVIVLDSPSGPLYYGGQVAAPVFPALASQVLRFRDVPPTEPVDARRGTTGVPSPFEAFELAAEPQLPEVVEDRDGAILVSGLAPMVEPAPENAGEPRRQGPPARIRVTTVETPDFVGMTVRQAMAEAGARGLEIDMRGAGLAIRQEPAAGTPVQAGTVVRVSFGRLIASAGTRP